MKRIQRTENLVAEGFYLGGSLDGLEGSSGALETIRAQQFASREVARRRWRYSNLVVWIVSREGWETHACFSCWRWDGACDQTCVLDAASIIVAIELGQFDTTALQLFLMQALPGLCVGLLSRWWNRRCKAPPGGCSLGRWRRRFFPRGCLARGPGGEHGLLRASRQVLLPYRSF